MGSSDKTPRPAYVDDVDEHSGKAVRGTRRSAVTKEKPKISHRDSHSSRTKKPHSDLGYSTGALDFGPEQSSAPAQRVEIVSERDVKLERRKSSGSNRSPHKSSRPTSGNEHRPKMTIPDRTRRDVPAYYGVPDSARTVPVITQPIISRPRAITSQSYSGRPLSYHATYSNGYGPPPSNSAYFNAPMIPPSYPPPSSSYMRYAATPQPEPFAPMPINAARALSSRFDPITRSSSAFGVRDGPLQSRAMADSYSSYDPGYDPSYNDDGYASASEVSSIRKRASIRVPVRMTKAEEDSASMPPPPRPGILRRPTVELPSPSLYNTDHSDAGAVYRETRQHYRDETPAPRRPSTNRNSVSYDIPRDSERVRIETANNSRRRSSYYGQSASTGSSGYEDKVREAAMYQDDVNDVSGGPSIPLTAEVLKRQQRRQAGSSRSTKSSGSRDESDYRRSATTRTTRSGSGGDDENVTIKVTGTARVMVGGAQIDCADGGEIEIKRQKALRNGSERSNSEYGSSRIDDRKSRLDRPSGRSRMSSASGHSYTRSSPQYAMGNYI